MILLIGRDIHGSFQLIGELLFPGWIWPLWCVSY